MATRRLATAPEPRALTPAAAQHRWATALQPRLAALMPGLALALAAGAIAATRAFDGLYGQDAYAYFDYSVQSVRQSLLHVLPLQAFFWPPGAQPQQAFFWTPGYPLLNAQPPQAFFWPPGYALLNAQPPQAFFWPPGYPLLVALASLPLGPTPLAGQLVSLLMGALVPILTVLLARELFPNQWALPMLAGVEVAVCGQLWQSSVVVMADTTGLALATFSAFALARYARGGRGAWLVAASAAIAYATLARWIYGIVAVPLAAYALYALWHSPNQGAASQARRAHLPGRPGAGMPRPSSPRAAGEAKLAVSSLLHLRASMSNLRRRATASSVRQRRAVTNRSQRRRVPLEAFVATLVAALMLGPILVPAVVSLVSHPTAPAAFAGNFQVYSWSPINALRHDFFTVDGHLEYSLPNGVYYAIAPANLAFFGPLLALCALPGLWSARAWSRPAALLVLGWTLSVYAFHAGAPWQNFRFTLAYMPPLAVLTASGIVFAWQRLAPGVALTTPLRRVFARAHAADLRATPPVGHTPPQAGRRDADLPPASPHGMTPPEAAPQEATLPQAGRRDADLPQASPHGATPPEAAPQEATLPQAGRRDADLPRASPHGVSPPEAAPQGVFLPEAAPYGASLPQAAARTFGPSGPTHLLLAAYATIALLIPAAAAVRLVERFIDTKDQELALVHWVQAQTPPDAELLTFGPTLAFRHYSALPTFDLYDLSTSEVDDVIHADAHVYVLVDEASLRTQWRNQAPANNLERARATGLDSVGTFGGYSLYRVGSAR